MKLELLRMEKPRSGTSLKIMLPTNLTQTKFPSRKVITSKVILVMKVSRITWKTQKLKRPSFMELRKKKN